MASAGLVSRMWRATKLQSGLYEEVEADKGATTQALIAVIIVSVATGLGVGLGAFWVGGIDSALMGLLIGGGTALVGWLLWALFVYLIGVNILKGKQTQSSWGEVLRTMGFANSPGFFRILAFIPVVGGLIAFIASIWSLIAAVIAVRAALDFSTWRAVVTALLGWLAYTALVFVLSALFGGLPLFGSLTVFG